MTAYQKYYKERYESLKAQHLCVDCGKKPADGKYVRCIECLAQMREYAERHKQRKIDAGLCFRCPNKAEDGKTYCSDCRLKQSKSLKEYYDRCVMLGICANGCGSPSVPGKRYCKDHALEARISKLKDGGVLDSEIPKIRLALDSFGGRCENCGITEPGGKGEWCLDHDHSTKLFRGILCNNCNSALGYAKENTEILANLIKYIRKHRLVKVA